MDDGDGDGCFPPYLAGMYLEYFIQIKVNSLLVSMVTFICDSSVLLVGSNM